MLRIRGHVAKAILVKVYACMHNNANLRACVRACVGDMWSELSHTSSNAATGLLHDARILSTLIGCESKLGVQILIMLLGKMEWVTYRECPPTYASIL